MSRPVAALLREIEAIRKSDLSVETKAALIDDLRKQIDEAASQLKLGLVPSPKAK